MCFRGRNKKEEDCQICCENLIENLIIANATKDLGTLSAFFFDPEISENFNYNLVGTTKASPIFNQISPKYRIGIGNVGAVGGYAGITPIFFEPAGANSLKNPRFEEIQRWFSYVTDDTLEDIL